jgi:hypothetical protein
MFSPAKGYGWHDQRRLGYGSRKMTKFSAAVIFHCGYISESVVVYSRIRVGLCLRQSGTAFGLNIMPAGHAVPSFGFA